MSIFEDAIEALGYFRQGTIAEAANIPDAEWDYRPHPDAKSVRELVKHIVQATAMLVGEAAHPEGDFQRQSPPEHMQEHAGDLAGVETAAELRSALEQTLGEATQRVREAGEDHMMTGIRRFDGGVWTRTTYVFYAAGHEDYHRGQLASYARALGLVPALTQRIHGDA